VAVAAVPQVWVVEAVEEEVVGSVVVLSEEKRGTVARGPGAGEGARS
jgi:hypothetical protein